MPRFKNFGNQGKYWGGGFQNSWRQHRHSIESMLNDIERDLYQYQYDPWNHSDDDDDDVAIVGSRPPPSVINVDSDDDEAGELFGSITANIVGIRYYQGTVNNNEMVSLHREPSNPYDRNAIRVDNVIGQQVGHIKREAAAALSSVLDRKLCRVEGTVPFGSKNVYSMPITLSLWGAADKKQETLTALERFGLKLKPTTETGKKKGAKGKKGETSVSDAQAATFERLNNFLNPRRTFLSQDEVRNEMDQLFDTLVETDKSTARPPAKAIRSPLYLHQQQALNWMICKERGSDLPPFWKEQNGQFYNVLTSYSDRTRPKSVCGGILADDMGLGKTLEVIALILTHFKDGQPLALPVGMAQIVPMTPTYIRNQSPNLELAAKPTKKTKKAAGRKKAAPKTSSTLPNLPSVTIADESSNDSLPCVIDNKAMMKKEDPEFVPDVNVVATTSRRPRRNVKRPVCYEDYEQDMNNLENTPKKVKIEPITKKGKGRGKKLKNSVPEPIKSNDTDILQPIMLNDPNMGPIKIDDANSNNSSDAGVSIIPQPIETLLNTNEPMKSQELDASKPIETVDTDQPINTQESEAPKLTETQDTIQPIKTEDTNSVGPIDLDQQELPDLNTVKSEIVQNNTTSSNNVITIEDELPDIPATTPTQTLEPPVEEAGVYYPPSGIDGTGRTAASGPRATLIVCPLSVLSNWLDQLDEHLHDCVNLNIHTFYGSQRTKNSKLLAEQDIVITTYMTLACDSKGQGVLKKVEWLRVVLDEGHIIRNPNTQQTKAVLEIQAHRRWVLSGTPIQNSLRDLWTLVKFLRIEPLTDRAWWLRTIQRPIMQGDASAIQRVQSLMGSIALRRTKTQEINGKRIVELPDRRVFLEHVAFNEEERTVYENMEQHGRIIIGRYFNQGTLLHHYGEVLAILMRLRQLCCHPGLVAKAVAKAIEEGARKAENNPNPDPASSTTDNTNISEDNRKRLVDQLLAVLNSGSDDDCAICLDGLNLPVITPCAHVFCRNCIEAVIRSERPMPKCPLCRGQIVAKDLVDVPPETQEPLEIKEDGAEWKSSSKVDALMKGLLKLREEDPTIKSLVVSQFTSLLTLVEIPLMHYGFKFARLDGTMTMKERSENVASFSRSTPDSPTIFLLSLKAGGVGINLTAASRVFLLDPAWNPASEEQCFDRCHRLGQTRDVIVTKFIVDNSVENKMLELQERKRKLMQGAFAKKMSPEERRQMRINDITSLIDIRPGGN